MFSPRLTLLSRLALSIGLLSVVQQAASAANSDPSDSYRVVTAEVSNPVAVDEPPDSDSSLANLDESLDVSASLALSGQPSIDEGITISADSFSSLRFEKLGEWKADYITSVAQVGDTEGTTEGSISFEGQLPIEEIHAPTAIATVSLSSLRARIVSVNELPAQGSAADLATVPVEAGSAVPLPPPPPMFRETLSAAHPASGSSTQPTSPVGSDSQVATLQPMSAPIPAFTPADPVARHMKGDRQIAKADPVAVAERVGFRKAPELNDIAFATVPMQAPRSVQVQQSSRFIWPAQGVISSGFGWRWGRMHKGIDIAGPIGTPIYAAASGTVTYSQWNDGGYGNLVEITHPDGSRTLYGHNNRLLVKQGQVVQQGQLIAEMGSTGYSTGPHSHFEIILPGQGPVNPIAHLPQDQRIAYNR